MKPLFIVFGLMLSLNLTAQSPQKANVYPNPASTLVKISFSEPVQTDITIIISDILGNKIEIYNYKPTESLQIDFSNLNLLNGLYLIKIETGNFIVMKRLLIKAN